MKYIYPAVFSQEDNEMISVRFPDVEGCHTFGAGIDDAISMAEDACCLMLYDMETEGKEIPAPSPVNDVEKKTDEFVSLIRCDTEFYRRFYKSKAVKKTLSIPEWLNEEAAKAGLNFSQVLQEGLKERLGLK